MKERLDILLTQKGLCETRQKAQSIIMSGIVFVGEVKVDKPGTKFNEDVNITIKGQDHPYVSRGGLKLEKGLKAFNIDPQGKICLDVGASSGGFTDCLLQNGGEKVYSVDVGYGQLAYKLRIDDRVSVFERTNFRNMDFEKIGEKVDIAVMDVSFISIVKLADNLVNFLKEDSVYISLIKPQFESEREMLSKNGVIKDSKFHIKILNNVIDKLYEKGIYLNDLEYSPIKGPKGNIEFIAKFTLNKDLLIEDTKDKIEKIVRKAHSNL